MSPIPRSRSVPTPSPLTVWLLVDAATLVAVGLVAPVLALAFLGVVVAVCLLAATSTLIVRLRHEGHLRLALPGTDRRLVVDGPLSVRLR